ncbi:HVO_2072 family ArtA-dependent S-layer glycoprotein, partial [Haloplanus litoreus]
MTDYNKQIRAVVLAALMVFSVFAGTVALSGTAAAASGASVNDPLTPTTPDEQTSVDHQFNVTIQDVTEGVPASGDDRLEILLPSEANGASFSDTTVTNNSTTLSGGGTDYSTNVANGVAYVNLTESALTGPEATGDVDFNVTLTVDWGSVDSDTDADVDYAFYDDGTQDVGVTTLETVTVQDTGGPGGATRAGPGGTGDFDTENGEGTIYDGATVFQGESDLELGGTLAGETLVKTAGDSEGVPLEVPDIPQSQDTGRYTTDGATGSPGVTVTTPRVTTLDVLNTNGNDIAGGSVSEGVPGESGAGNLTVVGSWNYEQAEDLELTVEDDSGLDVTGDVTSNPVKSEEDQGDDVNSQSIGSNEVGYDLDLSDSGTGTYTIELAGTDDLDFGQAVQTTTVTVTGDDDANIELDSDEVTRGEDVRFEIQGSDAGDTHTVLIEEDDFRDGISDSNAQRIFRNVGDTDEVGVVSGGGVNAEPRGDAVNDDIDYAYATITIDDDTGVGVGQIETQYLEDSDVDVYLYEQGYPVPFDQNSEEAEDNETDDQTLTVNEGDISIESPGSTYVVGSEVDVNGTADEGIDEVAFFVRRQNDYQLLQIDGQNTLTVDADGTFDEEDVVLSQGDGPGNNELSQPGTYRLGVIDADGVGGTIGLGDDEISRLTTSEFNTNTSAQQSLRVLDTELRANLKTVGGQVAVEDNEVNVSGDAFGSQQVTVVFVGERGNTAYHTVSVDDDNTFDDDDLTVSEATGGSGLAEGEVSAHVMIPGRDDQFGDGSFEVGRQSDLSFSEFIEELDNDNSGLTGQQVRSRLLDAT